MDDLSGLNESVEVPHEFKVDLNCLVLANLRITLEGISRAEDEELAALDQSLKQDDWEVQSAAASHARHSYDELRNAAICLAMVALVTRLSHWIGRFAAEIKIARAGVRTKASDAKRPKKAKSGILLTQLQTLNKSLDSPGPVSLTYFQGLVDVRDSVIHHDAKSHWSSYGEEVVIPACYCNPAFDRLELSEDHLREAVEKATKQVAWYDERLHRDASRRLQ